MSSYINTLLRKQALQERGRAILTNWSSCKVIRLAGGSMMLGYGIQQHDWLGIAFGSAFALYGLLTTGCGTSGCSIPGNTGNR